MLRRNSSNRAGRRKSTSSNCSKHESIDPEVARQHARTAAMLAFARAQERNSADAGHRGSGISHSNTTTSHQDQHFQATYPASNVDRGIKRQHSVRFVGPNAVQRVQPIGARAPNHTLAPKASSASLRPAAITTNAPVQAVYRPPSRSSSLGKASGGNGAADSYVTTLGAYNEYYTNEDDVASTPSSYRRIRKSKSMFSPIQAPNVFYTNGTPDRLNSRYHGVESSIANSRTPQTEPPGAALRTQKSMSFLRGGHEHLTSGLRERNDEAVQMARDRFFHQASQQRLREQPSFLFRSKAQRQEKPFRKSVRTGSSNSYGLPIASSNQASPPKESGLKEKARAVSKNIKTKLRRVFGRSKEEPVVVPNQQVDARETHVRQYLGDSDIMNIGFENIPHPNRATLSRVASRPPSLHAVGSNQQLRSHAGSVKSTKSDRSEDKSRVTSWNSTGVNTITSQGARLQAERDLQRLSIINENGTHVPSSSFNRQKLTNQFSAYPVIHGSCKNTDHIPAPVPGPVDSARVYSALMKRLDENSPKAKLEESRKASVESFTAPKNIPARSSSVHSRHSNRTIATIRHVLPGSSNGSACEDSANHEHQWVRANSIHSARAEEVFGYTGTHVHQWTPADRLRESRMRNEDDVFSPKPDMEDKERTFIDLQRGRSVSTSTQDASIKTSYHTVPENFGLTPQEMAYRNEPMVQVTPILRDERSTFFGGTTVTIARTTSPFRRALADGDHNPAAVNVDALRSVHEFPLPPNPLYSLPQSAPIPEVRIQYAKKPDKAYTESVYSRTTSGHTPAAANSVLSFSMPEDEVPAMPFPRKSTGDVIILDRATYRPAMPGAKGHRVTSSASSIEWKKWMSSEVAKLERARDNNHSSASYVNYALPTMPKSFHAGHVRESAQIVDDDTDIAQKKAGTVKQPVGILQQSMNVQNIKQINQQNTPLLKPILKNRSMVSLVENVESKNMNSTSIPIPPPPPIPVRSPLRIMPSKSSLYSINTVNTFNTACTQSAPSSAVKVPSVNGRSLLRKRNASQTTLRSTKSMESPAKLVKRNGRKSPHTTNTPSPKGGIGAAFEKQSGSASTGTRSRTPGGAWSPNRENYSPQQREDIYEADGAGLMGPSMSDGAQELDAQQMGSKRMVDLFLSSRRRRIAGGSEESSALFL